MPEYKFSVLLLEPRQLERWIDWMGPESYKRWTGRDLDSYSDKLAWS